MSQEKMKFKKRSLIKDYLRLIGKRTRVVIESSGILGNIIMSLSVALVELPERC